ncbi:gamma-type small acid-soluble spore protein [Solibacillus sp. CAU 1738]|uniref:gamma-type small acid-soluble spore protein n=1 Tax=Solibacillus sp. CAU 1738 TaxID=3140363 RepID=UPI003261B685
MQKRLNFFTHNRTSSVQTKFQEVRFMPNNNQNFNQNMNTEFGSETDVNQVKQQIQQAEAKKQQASNSNTMNVEFGSETDVNQVKQKIQQAEAKKQQASGIFGNNGYQNGNK